MSVTAVPSAPNTITSTYLVLHETIFFLMNELHRQWVSWDSGGESCMNEEVIKGTTDEAICHLSLNIHRVR